MLQNGEVGIVKEKGGKLMRLQKVFTQLRHHDITNRP